MISLFCRYIPSIKSVPLYQGITYAPVWSSVPSRFNYRKRMTSLFTLKGTGFDSLPKFIKSPPSVVALPDEAKSFTVLSSYMVKTALAGGGPFPGLANIGNYYTQRVLKPLHDWLMNILRRLPTDGTFCQDAPLDRLSGLSGPCYSIDLKAATDRMPVYFLWEVIGMLFGLPFASQTMYSSLALTSVENRVFPPGKRNKLITFNAGQPLLNESYDVIIKS